MFSCSHFKKLTVLRPDTGEKTRRRRTAWLQNSRSARNLVSVTFNRSRTVSSSILSQSSGNLAANCATLDSLSTGRNLSRWIRNDNRASRSRVTHTLCSALKYEGTCHEIEKEHQCWIYGQCPHIRTTETCSKWSRSMPTKWSGDSLLMRLQSSCTCRKYSEENLRVTKKKSLWLDFCCTLCRNWSLIKKMKYWEYTIEWDQTPRKGSTLIREHVVKLSTAKFYVFSDSGPCLGDRIAEYLICTRCFTILEAQNWMDQKIIISIVSRTILTENQVVFEWKIFLGHTTLKYDDDVQRHQLGRVRWCWLCKKSSPRILVIRRTWFWRKMVCYICSKTRQFVERSRWTNDTYICRKRTSRFQEEVLYPEDL